MKYAAAENAAVFGTPQRKFSSAAHTQGDLLVMRAHAAAREAIKAICPEVKVGLTLSLHDLQAQPGGEAFAAAAWRKSSPTIFLILRRMTSSACRTTPARCTVRRGSCPPRRVPS